MPKDAELFVDGWIETTVEHRLELQEKAVKPDVISETVPAAPCIPVFSEPEKENPGAATVEPLTNARPEMRSVEDTTPAKVEVVFVA